MRIPSSGRPLLLGTLALCAVLAGGATRVVQDQCGPFTDVTPAFCPYILELYYLGVTAGTSATTFSPDDPLTRGQGSVFVAKGLNQALARSSRRAALGQWWTTRSEQALGLTTVGPNPQLAVSDGADVWVSLPNSVARVRASDGKLVETWTVAAQLNGITAAMGQIFATGYSSGGYWALYRIDPALPAGAMTEVARLAAPLSVAFDGSRFWTANGDLRSVSITTPGPTLPWQTTTISPQDLGEPLFLVFDGSSMWAITGGEASFVQFDESGAILRTVLFPDYETIPGRPAFDGTNFWVPDSYADSVILVRASDGAVLTTLTGKGLVGPILAAFDGTRVLVTSTTGVFLWNASDLTPIGFTPIGAGALPYGVCSDGLNFWITLEGIDQLARF
jgi:hypothetical protein